MIKPSYKIGAHVYKVDHSGGLGSDDHFGKGDLNTLKLFINNKVPVSLQEETLLHEVLHQIRVLNGIDLDDEKEEEKIVQCEAHGLYLFLKDNGLWPKKQK